MCRCRQLLSGFLVNSHLSRVSRQSHFLANDKDDNEAKSEAEHWTPGIYLKAEKKTGKAQLRELSTGYGQIALS